MHRLSTSYIASPNSIHAFSEQDREQMISDGFAKCCSEAADGTLTPLACVRLINLVMRLSIDKSIGLVRLYAFFSNKFLILDQSNSSSLPQTLDVISEVALAAKELSDGTGFALPQTDREYLLGEVLSYIVGSDNYPHAVLLSGILTWIVSNDLSIFTEMDSLLPYHLTISKQTPERGRVALFFILVGKLLVGNDLIYRYAESQFKTSNEQRLAEMWLQILYGSLELNEFRSLVEKCVQGSTQEMQSYTPSARAAVNSMMWMYS